MKLRRTDAARYLLGALGLLAASAIFAQDGSPRFEAFVFQQADRPDLADLAAVKLQISDSNRADIGSQFILVQTDQTGLARIQDDAVGKIEGPTVVYKLSGKPVLAPDYVRNGASKLSAGKGQPKTYYLVALLEPAPDREEQFNDFYDATHLPEVISVPGMQWGVRGRLVSQKPDEFGAPRYMALYEFRSFDLAATKAEVGRRLTEHITQGFPKGSVGKNSLVFYGSPTGDGGPGAH